VLVRSWNLFHGNAYPPEPRAFLEEMVRLVSADEPDVLCLQEVPVWALPLLGQWSGMLALGERTVRPSLGPLPLGPALARRLTAVDNGLFRSAFAGQANAILLSRRLRALRSDRAVLNAARFRRAQARWLGIDPILGLTWAKERRLCHAVRIALPDGGTMLLANLHATGCRDDRLPDAEALRAAVFVDALAQPDEPVVLAGDFNLRAARSRTLRDLQDAEWGFSKPGPGVNHVLVRGAKAGPLRIWPPQQRIVEGRLLSDHAPVELEVG
jgi:endonuclease/exonuclease/phosphatase family metal-dependent hydrolase